MGSSVTAGHDTLFNITFPTLTGQFMAPPFEILGIKLNSLNVAMGNNPCQPYDICVHAFAGKEADIVHWEQAFNCFGSHDTSRVPFEHFIRQSLSLKNQAVVVFSDSGTPNWNKDKCSKPTPVPEVSEDEKKMLRLIETEPIKVFTEVNVVDDKHVHTWQAMHELFKYYKIAGIQVWNHGFYEKYACHGPYIADWGCCSAAWHPSKLGHELRAAHHSYVWLLILRDALDDLLSAKPEELDAHIHKHIKHSDIAHKYVPKQLLYDVSNFTETLKCYTSFLPIEDPDLDLLKLVVSTKAHNGKEPFKNQILEHFSDPNIIRKAEGQGYRDYKRMLYGNNHSVPLSLKLDIQHLGYVSICEPPGVWGSYPTGFKSFYKDNLARAFITKVESYSDDFIFDQSMASEVPIRDLNKGTQIICAEIATQIPVGKYVLTMVPTTEINIMISYLIVP